MRLTRYTDDALRVLTYLATQPDRVCSITEIARADSISQNHLMKVPHEGAARPGQGGLHRGRARPYRRHPSRAARRQDQRRAVVRQMEDGFNLVDCDTCAIAPASELTRTSDDNKRYGVRAVEVLRIDSTWFDRPLIANEAIPELSSD